MSNLAAAWPNDAPDNSAPFEELRLRLKLTPELDDLPNHWSWTVEDANVGVPQDISGSIETAQEISVSRGTGGFGRAILTIPSLSFRKTVHIDFPDVGTRTEVANGLLYPFLSVDALFYKAEAEAFAAEISTGC